MRIGTDKQSELEAQLLCLRSSPSNRFYLRQSAFICGSIILESYRRSSAFIGVYRRLNLGFELYCRRPSAFALQLP